MEKYDLIVIGSGTSGAACGDSDVEIWQEGRKNRQNEGGGRRGNRYRHDSFQDDAEAVMHLSGYYYQNIYGGNYRLKEKITMSDLVFRVQHVIKTEIDVTQAQLCATTSRLLFGIASFVFPQPGSRLRTRVGDGLSRGLDRDCDRHQAGGLSPQFRFNGRNIVNSDQILQMPEIPKTLIVVGGE